MFYIEYSSVARKIDKNNPNQIIAFDFEQLTKQQTICRWVN